jgi:hypothetical protein
MAITVVIAATKDATSGATTEFTTTGPFVLYGDHFGWAESAQLLRLGPSGEYLPATNKDGVIQVDRLSRIRGGSVSRTAPANTIYRPFATGGVSRAVSRPTSSRGAGASPAGVPPGVGLTIDTIPLTIDGQRVYLY